MIYFQHLLIFGLVPLLGLALVTPHLFRRYKGTFFWVVTCILLVSVPWEGVSVDRIWFYSPQVILGLRLLGIPVALFLVAMVICFGAFSRWLHRKKREGARYVPLWLVGTYDNWKPPSLDHRVLRGAAVVHLDGMPSDQEAEKV